MFPPEVVAKTEAGKVAADTEVKEDGGVEIEVCIGVGDKVLEAVIMVELIGVVAAVAVICGGACTCICTEAKGKLEVGLA